MKTYKGINLKHSLKQGLLLGALGLSFNTQATQVSGLMNPAEVLYPATSIPTVKAASNRRADKAIALIQVPPPPHTHRPSAPGHIKRIATIEEIITRY